MNFVLMQRRNFLQKGMLASAGFLMNRHAIGSQLSGLPAPEGTGMMGDRPDGMMGDRPDGMMDDFPVVRIPESQRKFRSSAVENTIRDVRGHIGNKETGWLFENCFPNTL